MTERPMTERPMTKSNEGFRAKRIGRMHRVTVDVFMAGNPGEIEILYNAAYALNMLAQRGYMPPNTREVTREVLDAEDS